MICGDGVAFGGMDFERKISILNIENYGRFPFGSRENKFRVPDRGSVNPSPSGDGWG
jgi:hypothetical protein